MAKTYEELLEQAAIIRDETAAGKNTATRVGGTITDAVDYVKELQDTYAGIHAEAAAAKTAAAAAKSTASEAKTESAQAVSTAQKAQTKNAEQDNRLKNAEEQNTKQNERLLNYVYPKLYQLNEGAGARAFHGFTEATGVGGLILTKDTYRYRVLYSTTQKQFVLGVTDEASGAGVRVGTFAIWDKIILPNGSSIASSDSYAQRDILYYIFEPNDGSTYYYIDSNGKATEQSATYLLRRLVDKNTAAIAKLQGNVVGPGGDNSDYGEQIKELGAFDTFAALLEKAAKFYIVSNSAIALLHGTYKKADVIYNGVLILQQVENNSDGSGTAMQYIYNQNKQFTRSITFSATSVTSVQLPQNYGARNLSLSGRVLQMTNMWGDNVGDSATLPDNGNIYEGEAGASSVPVVLAKTFGGTVNATLGAATSARAGVMTVDHVNKIKKLEERVLQYLYPKLYQLNEGAGALPFDGEYSGSASVLDGRKTVAVDGCTYKVLFALMLKKFLLQEISPGGVTIGFYEEWDKIISGRGSSEDYTRRDCLYYIFEPNEGSTYYYIDSNGKATEQSATYLLRRLVDENAAAIDKLKTTAENAQNKLSNYADTFSQNPVASSESNGLMSADDKAKFESLKVEFEKVKNSIGVNIYGSVRVSGISDPQLTFRRYIADGAAGNPLDVIHPCLVEKGTGKLLHILQNLNFEKDINGAPRKIDGSEGEVYITNTEPIYHITGHVYVNGVSYDVFLRSLYPFTWQGKEAEVIEPFGLSPDNCVAHKDDDGVTRMHSVYNPEWAGSYYAMNGFVGKYVYEGIGNAMTDTYDASGALFNGAGGLASVSISLTNGEQYAMNMNEDTTKTVPFFNEHAYALELFIGHMYAEGGTYDAHNAALMGSGFTANDNVTTAAHFNADNEPAVNGARYLGGDGSTTRYVNNSTYGQWYSNGTKNYLPSMLTNWSSPWKIMERQRVMAYAIESNIPELTWFAFEGNKYKWRSINGFAGPNDGVMTCVVFKIFSTKFASDMVDPTGGASLEGHRIDFMITGAMYRGWSTDVSPSRWDSGLIFTTDNTALYKAYIQRDQSKMIKSASADVNADTVLPFEESYDYIGSVQGIQRNYRRDFSDGSIFHAKSTEMSKGAALHTYIGAFNWYDSKSSAAGLRSVRGFRRGLYANNAYLSPCAVHAFHAPSYATTGIGFGTCVRLVNET